MRFLLNSAVLTAFGTWDYQSITPRQAYGWLMATCEACHDRDEMAACAACQGTGYPWQSTIGYAETATAIEQLCGLDAGAIPVHRVQIQMRTGDEALIFRLVLPPGSARINPADKGQIADHIEAGHWELGLLRRTA